MNKILLSIIFVFLLGCTHTPSIYKEQGTQSIKSNIQHIIDSSGLSTNMGIKIVSLKSNKTLYELNAKSLFNPASNTKIYTCIAAISFLEPNYTFKTEVYQDQDVIYLVGGGDPDLSLNELDSLATIVSSKIQGAKKLVIDDTRLDSTLYGEGWMWDEGAWWYAAEISALSVNDNCVDFYINPGGIGEPASVLTNPISDYFQIENTSLTVNDTSGFKKFKIDRDWRNQVNQFTIVGNIMDTTSTDTIYRNIHNPSYYVGTLFKESLQRNGIIINQITRGNRPSNAKWIGHHESESLIHSLQNLMVESDNLTAELLVKTIGFESTKTQGNWDNGLLAVKTFLNNDVGIDTTQLALKDGSGVSRYNYSSANHFIQLLSWAYHTPSIRDLFIHTLPIGGQNGTIENRMLPASVRAKTGSLSGVSALSGYVITQSGEPIVFSILMNGFTGSTKPYRDLQDHIVQYLEGL
ncbi:MAG: D-alanyl-D-alanine carboxypeptidase/D-alanyl-D-alanine-endopeptidase [Candidatus Marinimicrobia bacterium]|nr:D-alanyl-D-alanine carboxypeptidase/D-alanyl-D-alanine-endopeptidase [Candidatus Neomarinimicrobiota bacterium]MBL7009668.1 D-alanyl-D-alanine carboxypeptidase/D-alanyl-D-alanine-endopeptidase [Candidatus Neomarinimicrobiota bacterium]MBL7029589.1 D-alanyl-D-alanine carboxypeptidase/D-alanyl-D-alanine-endopeptidase [Candidatus Neomarinimicrobiota bacterium]